MSSVVGVLAVGEAPAVLQNIDAYQRGADFISYVALLALVVAGAAVAVAGGCSWQSASVFWGGFGFICGTMAYANICMRLTLVRWRRRLVASEFPLQLCLRMEITPDALVYKIGEEQYIAKWPAVTKLYRSDDRKYWKFLTQSSPYFAPYFIPRRFFPKRFPEDDFAERAFISEALAHMNEAARLRSKGAVAFAKART